MKPWQTSTQLWRKLRWPVLYVALVRGATAALAIQTLNTGIDYIQKVLLAQWMGAAEYGLYEYVSTISIVLALLAGLGGSRAVLRLIPEYTVKQDWAHLRGIIQVSLALTLVASLVTSSCGTVLLLWQTACCGLENVTLLILGLWTVPLVALANLQLEMARAVRRIVLAFAPYLIVYPLLLIGVTYFWVKAYQSLTSVSVLAFSIAILLIVLGVQLMLLCRFLPREISSVLPAISLRQWLEVSLPLLFVDGSFLILYQIDKLLIGAILGTRFVGIYSAAVKTASWVTFILAAVNAIAVPEFASLYAKGDLPGLQRLTSTISRWMFLPALIVALGLILFAEPVLKLFGAEFVAGKWVMMTLILGQLVNVGTGSVSQLLSMTGYQKQCAIVVSLCALINCALNLIWIPWLGIQGAALATSISMALWNIWLNSLVVKYLGVNPSIVAALRMKV